MVRGQNKHVYFFGKGKAEGNADMRQLLGGKGAGLAEMTHVGLPVPCGFTITTDCCASYNRNDARWPRGLESQVKEGLKKLERTCRKKFGDSKDPLLLSVRSGAAVSMPGMMESILNLGLNDKSVEGLGKVSGNLQFALDAYRRFIMMFGSTAKGINRDIFEDQFRHLKDNYTRSRIGKPHNEEVLDTEVNEQELYSLINVFKDLYREHTAEDFPQSPHQQLLSAISAVFESWLAEKAVTYRRVENITGLQGTAVTVMQMVFGNMGDDSGTGVCFTRDPSTGENEFYGDLLINAQGEDVVAGVRTPVKLIELKRLMPDAYEQLEAVRVKLELHYQDMQDLEFTIERGKLYMLQCRAGKRSPQATFKIAVDQATKPLLSRAEANRLSRNKRLPRAEATRATKPVITREQAINRVKSQDIERLFSPVIDPEHPREELQRCFLAKGINAVPGAACGRVAFSVAAAEELAASGEDVILVRKVTSPEDVGGMHVAVGILTATGGPTSHAAVVARGWGKCCIVGCAALHIDYASEKMWIGETVISQGDYITLDGTTGELFSGQVPLVSSEMPKEYTTLMSWCDQIRRLKVRTNADTPNDARFAVEQGAEGIGLCRTEHMFFATEERRLAMQEMILADTTEGRRIALAKLLPFQQQDFTGIFQAMNGLPVTIRLVDPPLHEFLPHTTEEMAECSRAIGVPIDVIRQRTEQLHESNPMLGHRGCRLSITYPEILDMQVTAVIDAAIECLRNGISVLPEIMIPLTIDPKELERLIVRTRKVADELLKAAGEKVKYTVGTMIETPRAALLGDRLAECADFFSFGTNDLTQTTMALSRDDSGRFLPDYIDVDKSGIFEHDPFQSIDVDGVGLLIKWGIERGRSTKPNLKIGICGEHGGESRSVKFFHEVGMDYVSCSPYRVPVARLSAAQAEIESGFGSAIQFSSSKRRAAAKVRPTKRKTTRKKKRATKSKTKKSPSRAKKTKKSAAKKRSVTKKKKVSKKKTAGKAKKAKKTSRKKKAAKKKRR